MTRPVHTVEDLLNSSIGAQIGVAAAYFSSLNPAVSNVIPVFFTLASGQACPEVLILLAVEWPACSYCAYVQRTQRNRVS
jgi:hypothetical protein